MMKLHEFRKEVQEKLKHKIVRDKTELAIRVGSEVYSLRVSCGLTQQQLAEQINTKQSNIARIEKGKVLPRLSTLHRIAESVGTHVIEPTFASLAEKREKVTKENYTNLVEHITPVFTAHAFVTNSANSNIESDKTALVFKLKSYAS